MFIKLANATRFLCALAIFACVPVAAQNLPPTEPAQSLMQTSESLGFDLIPVGLNVGNRNIVPSTFVRGAEDGIQAIAFEDWLIPIDEITKVLKLQTTTLADGSLELRTSRVYVRIAAKDLKEDPDLGNVLSVRQISELLAVEVSFDVMDYAIRFDVPWENEKLRPALYATTPPPISVEGLPKVIAPTVSFTRINPQLTYTQTNNQGNQTDNLSGNVVAVGSLLGGSWYLNLRQNAFDGEGFSQVQEFQYWQSKAERDLVIGSHNPFWQSRRVGDYWGITHLQRFGYEPTQSIGGGGFVFGQRLQSNSVLQNLEGFAAPGTLVQLTRGNSNEILAETLVDDSGIYHFPAIASQNRGLNSYRLLFYDNGLLTSEPRIEDIEFLSFSEQLSKGTSALTLSTGFDRQRRSGQFLGDFDNPQAAIAYRAGISDTVTLGVGAVQSDRFQTLGELFYQPKSIPLRLGIVGFASPTADPDGNNFDYDIVFEYRPSSRFTLDLQGDQDYQRFRIATRPFNSMTLDLRGNNQDETITVSSSFSGRIGRQLSFFANADYTNADSYRFSLLSRIPRWDLRYVQDERRYDTNLTHYITGTSSTGSSVWVEHQQENAAYGDDYTLGVGYQYRSAGRAPGGNYHWQVGLGYRWNRDDSGIVASLNTEAITGLSLRASYEAVSAFTEGSRFQIQFSPSFNLQPSVGLGDQQTEFLRNHGGLLIKPFIDTNNNGKLDEDEELYIDTINELVLLNNQRARSPRNYLSPEGLYILAQPGVHRLDLDPAGYPFDTTPDQNAIAVEVVAGSYTPIPIAFRPSYILVGTVTDSTGKPVANARVQAIGKNTDTSNFSITNAAGIYFIEGLTQDEYQILIDGQPAQPKTVTIDQGTEQLLELDLSF